MTPQRDYYHSNHKRGGSAKVPRDGNNNDKDLKAFSLPRNFLVNPHHNHHHYRNHDQKISPDFYSPKVGNLKIFNIEQQINGPEEMFRSLANPIPNSNNYEDSFCSSINSLREDFSPVSRYYDLKNSNSDNVLSDITTNCPNFSNQIYSSISNSLVFDTISQHYPSLRSDDVYSSTTNTSNSNRFSGSSTPGAASSVSCSDDFSFAPLEKNRQHLTSNNSCDQFNAKNVSFDNYINNANNDDEDASSSDSSTPSFSSLSCVLRYPNSLSPISIQSNHDRTNSSIPSSKIYPKSSTQSSNNSSNNSTPRHQPKQLKTPTKSTKSNNKRPNSRQLKTDSSEQEMSDLELSNNNSSLVLFKQHKMFVPKKEVDKVYSVGDSIGDGKFGVVYHCVHRITRRVYALKVVDKSAMQEMIAKSTKSRDSSRLNSTANSEAAILKQICHPNIVRIYDHFEFVDQSYLVLELFKVCHI